MQFELHFPLHLITIKKMQSSLIYLKITNIYNKIVSTEQKELGNKLPSSLINIFSCLNFLLKQEMQTVVYNQTINS